MIRCAIIADDLTGANATGVMLKKLNYSTATIMNLMDADLSKLKNCDCVTFTTNSRGVDAQQAYFRVYNLVKMLLDKNVEYFTKRVDSTIRGNLGAETDGALDALGDDYIAIVVACAPPSGRVTMGGYMLVNGVPLHKTEVALDPKAPIRDSRVAKLFEKETKYKVSSIYMADLSGGKEAIAEKIHSQVADGSRIIVFDAVSQEDIDLICDAVIESHVRFVAVDPGAFTATMMLKTLVPSHLSEKKILLIEGSVNPVAKVQMENLWLAQRVYNVFVHTRLLVESENQRKAEIARITAEASAHAAEYDIISVTVDGIDPAYRLNFPEYAEKLSISVDEVSDLINNSMAEIAYRLLKLVPEFGGIYTSGGDVTAAVCSRCQAIGLELMDEVIPLAACGAFMEGDFAGKFLVTKGGMTGNPDAINTCVAKLKGLLHS